MPKEDPPTQHKTKKDEELDRATGELNQRILGGVKTKTGEVTAAWIVNPSEDVPIAGLGETDTKELGPGDLTPNQVIDKLLDQFLRYASELSQKNPNVNVRINCERPIPVKEPTGAYQPDGTVQNLAYMCTSQWAMIFLAWSGKIKVYIAPTDFVVAFNTRRDEFPVLLTIGTAIKRGTFMWDIVGQALTGTSFSILSKKLFARMLRVNSGAIGPDAPFSLVAAKDSKDPEAMVSHDTLSSFWQDDASTPALMGQNVAPVSPAPAPAVASSRPSPAPAPAALRTPVSSTAEGGGPSVAESFMVLINAVDQELDHLSNAGLKALKGDMAEVTRVMEATASARSIREKLIKLADEWHSSGGR